jgi:hypothetical protein
MTGDISSSAFWVPHLDNFAIQAVWTGTPTGTLKLQCSCDKGSGNVSEERGAPTNWTDIVGSSQSTAGAAGSNVWNVQNAGYRWVRVVFTFGSGTGSLSVTANGKGPQ